MTIHEDDVEERIISETKFKLNSEKIKQLKKYWGLLLNDYGVETVGEILFKNIFTIAPKATDYFSNFKGLVSYKLYADAKFKKHAAKVINAVTDTINLLDKPTDLKNVLQNLGKTHQQLGIPKAAFAVVGNALNSSLIAAFGQDVTIEIVKNFSLF